MEAITLIVLSITIVLIYRYYYNRGTKVLLEEKQAYEELKHKYYVDRFEEVVTALGESRADSGRLLLELSESLKVGVLEDVVSQRKMAEESVAHAMRRNTKDLEEAENIVRQRATDHHNKLEASLEQKITKTKAELRILDTIFRTNHESDPTRRLLSAAYAVVMDNKPPRNELDSQLTNAVISHRKETGADTVPTEGKFPDSKDMN